MTEKLSNWIRDNRLAVVLLIVVGYFLYRMNSGYLPLTKEVMVGRGGISEVGMEPAGDMAVSSIGIMPPIYNEVAPTDVENRLVIRDTSLSLQVNDVSKAISEIEAKAVSLGGYLVDSSLYVPEGAATGSVTVRIPEEKRQEAMDEFKGLAVKVVNENVYGFDVTDQFVDLEARLATLNKTKAKFEAILDSATEIQDILQVQSELINIQSQIDSLVGQREYLSQSAKLTKIMISLSTDEFALPYTPDEAWRPGVIFKTAVRSLVTGVRSFGTLVIWLAVYLPVILAIWLVWKLVSRKRA